MYEAFKIIENNRRQYLLKCVEKLKREQELETQRFNDKYNDFVLRREKNKQNLIHAPIVNHTQEKIEVNNTNNTIKISETIPTEASEINSSIQGGLEQQPCVDTVKTNIPYSQYLIKKFHLDSCKSNINTTDMAVKCIINKRIAQISTDLDHITEIAREIKRFTKDVINNSQISLKLIEQGKLQVSIHKDSYKSYSYFLSCIYTTELLEDFRAKVMTTEIHENRHFTGVYLIYFGFLKLMKMFEEASYFLSNIINVKPSAGSLYVLEAFILTLGNNMYSIYEEEFKKVHEFLRNEHFSNADNEPIKARIYNLLNKIDK